ncbi:MAG TPA: hypothetical protein VL051_11245 [Burkholderiaceae bacterium]|nr:hypothetical protein [Burkholderiaceae bacterium]
MTHSKPFHPRRLLLVAAVLLGAAAALPTYASPPPWAPAHGHRAKQAQQYRYVYYPAQQVYYAPASQTWFWMSGSNWRFGVNLPAQYRGYAASGGVPVVLHSSRPYVEHVYVEKNYGRPWREKHRKQKKDKRSHHDRHYDR